MITPQDGVVIARRYTLTRPLARGGMGSVWVARHRDLEIDVTVKFMDPLLVAAADARARFEHEARSAARLDSQHVVQVIDYGIEDDTPYMVMELLRGETLATRLTREGRVPTAATARLVIQVCKALRTAHEAGLVHRDLKPGNVFLAIKDEDEVVKVLDFGIAKSASLGKAGTGTESGAVLGSAHYMSPEQVRSSATVDGRSDLWSLAVILYRMLVGRLPFPGKDFGDVLVRVCTDDAPAPSSITPDLPARLDGFFVRAFARDPAQRFQSARELAEAFCSIAMEAQPGAGAPVPPVSSALLSSKRTMRMDLLSVPPPPPSSEGHGVPMVETPGGTQIMRGAPPAAMGPPPAPPPPAADEHAPLTQPEPTLRAASSPGPTAPEVDHVADDPPAVPVHSFWPAWVAAGLVAAAALAFVAFRGSSSSAAAPVSATSTPTAPVAITPAPPEPSTPPAPPIATTAPVTMDAGAPASAAATSAPVRGTGRVQKSKIVDGIIRDPFAK